MPSRKQYNDEISEARRRINADLALIEHHSRVLGLDHHKDDEKNSEEVPKEAQDIIAEIAKQFTAARPLIDAFVKHAGGKP